MAHTAGFDRRDSRLNLVCPGSASVERSYQPRLIALAIVPNYLKEQRTTEYPANGSSDRRNRSLMPQRR